MSVRMFVIIRCHLYKSMNDEERHIKVVEKGRDKEILYNT